MKKHWKSHGKNFICETRCNLQAKLAHAAEDHTCCQKHSYSSQKLHWKNGVLYCADFPTRKSERLLFLSPNFSTFTIDFFTISFRDTQVPDGVVRSVNAEINRTILRRHRKLRKQRGTEKAKSLVNIDNEDNFFAVEGGVKMFAAKKIWINRRCFCLSGSSNLNKHWFERDRRDVYVEGTKSRDAFWELFPKRSH